jgi:Holliday junction resolvasome RuvABC DNA-binding subunit
VNKLAPKPLAHVRPTAPDRFALQVTINQVTRDKLERAQALLRHRNPSGDLAEVIECALDALLVQIEKKKFGATTRPRATKVRGADADLRYVSNEVRRAVHARDGEQCTFLSEAGVRCTERGFLELDHRTLVAHGGQPTVENLRTLCRSHNQFEAERVLGVDVVRAKRAEAKVRRADAAVKRADAAPGRPPADHPPELESDVTLALRGLGFKTAEVDRAMATTARLPAETFDQRIRAALAELTRARAFRCSDGPFDMLTQWN